MLSIIIRAYNAAKVIPQAIESVLAQTASANSYEIIVVDDGSKDDLESALQSYKDKIVLVKKKNGGAVRAANIGVAHSKGEYITLLDADDVLQPDFVKKMMEAVNTDRSISFAYCDYFEDVEGKRKIVSLKENIFNCIATAIVFKKEDFLKVGGYDESIIFAEYDIIKKLQIANCKGEHVPFPLYVYIRGKHSLTANKAFLEKAFSQIKERYGDLPIRKY